jgi:hypothetical protein
MPITEVPVEVFLYNILPILPVADVLRLTVTNKAKLSSELYSAFYSEQAIH